MIDSLENEGRGNKEEKSFSEFAEKGLKKRGREKERERERERKRQTERASKRRSHDIAEAPCWHLENVFGKTIILKSVSIRISGLL